MPITSLTECFDRTHTAAGSGRITDEIHQEDMDPMLSETKHHRVTSILSVLATKVQLIPGLSSISNDSTIEDVGIITDEHMSLEDVPTAALARVRRRGRE